jgi:two-component system sensor kinase FixL
MQTDVKSAPAGDLFTATLNLDRWRRTSRNKEQSCRARQSKTVFHSIPAMTWITFLWPMLTAACITIGLIHIRIGLRRMPGTANLLFALAALLFATFSVVELGEMLARSPAQYLNLLRLNDFIAAAGAMTLAAFVRVYFGTGRKWLAWIGVGLLLGSLTLDLLPEPKLVFLQITGIKTVETFGGASFTVADGVRNPWVTVYYAGVLLIALFVADASITLWHRGRQRRAVLVGGTITFFLLAAGIQAALVDAGVLPTPYLVSLFYLIILVAMAMELSDEVLQASQLSDDLRESERRLNLAADTAHLGLWVWDTKNNEIWTTPQCRVLFGITTTEPLDPTHFFDAVHPDDRDRMQQDVAESLRADTDYEREYRLLLADDEIRWIAVRGHVARNKNGEPVQVRGVALDVSRRKQAEEATLQLSGQLINAREAERRRLARELHDDLNQHLALLAVELELFGQKPPAVSSAITERMQVFTEQVKKLSSAVHQLSHELHPAKLEQLGLESAVRGFCRELSAARKFEIVLESREVPRTLPENITLCLYRVVQEGLQNVVKHSGANGAKVEMTADENELCLVVSDQGCGFDIAKSKHGGTLGLVSMRERVRLVNGRITIQSRRGEGTRIQVQIPLTNTQESTQS